MLPEIPDLWVLEDDGHTAVFRRTKAEAEAALIGIVFSGRPAETVRAVRLKDTVHAPHWVTNGSEFIGLTKYKASL